MKSLSWPSLLLFLAFLSSAAGLVVSLYQSIDLWQQWFAGRKFEGLSGPDTGYHYALFLLMLSAPLALSLFTVRRWHLPLRGFALSTTIIASSFPVYAALCVAILYGNAA